MSTELKLAGKRAVVTGSGTGIGREVALEFARQGADVVLHYAHSDTGAKSAVEEIRAMGRKAEAFKANFGIVKEVVGLGNQAIEFLGGVDCLVNNAGITTNLPFFDVTEEQFDTLYHVNIRAQFFLTQRIGQDMLSRGKGTVVNMTSIHGFAGAPEHSVYAGTKGAIIAYTRVLGVELAHKGIRVNAISPGAVIVENQYKAIEGMTEKDVDDFGYNKIPLGRIGIPIDIAKLAVFLSSDDSGYIVGQTIIADGGTTALMSLTPDFRTKSTVRFGKGYVPGI
ncbi:MAG: SDR family oxidoreductase [Armatimonadetes bacterium]|nr:SDR family oxidoreductase [Armatimonadota bacterium]